MKNMAEKIKTLDEIKTLIDLHRDILADSYGIAITGVFGSYVRGEEAISIFSPGFFVPSA